MADKFQPDFYVACATLIPVLFLALAVQGGTFESVLRTTRRLRDEYDGPPMEGKREQARQVTALVTASFLPYVAGFILVSGGFGEALALVALYNGSEAGSPRFAVLASALILVAAVVAGPFLVGLRAGSKIGLPDFQPSRQTPRGVTEAVGDQGGEPPQETGGNDGQPGES